ncbi:LINE-1 retrotransposable element ORF2 protein [Schistosoma japonicum]|nr:LINE-1 retrotransposable element ORF2 protein [Schistosoma japonicum]KAH8870478.1 LINE-1 retrotransposable element ORF2 protein [Schistosoma japonicum]
MLFAEAVDNNKSLDVSYCRLKETGPCYLHVYPDAIEIRSANKTHRVTLDGLNISCMTCKNLCLVNSSTLSCRFDASYNNPTCELIGKLNNVQSNVTASDSILCKFCQLKLGNIKDVACTADFQKAVTLRDEDSCFEGGFFCHQTTDSPGKIATNSVNTQSFLFNLNMTPTSNCIFTGVELIMDPSLIEPQSIQFKGNEFLHCSCCLMALGKKVLYGSKECIVLWANCTSLLIKENDIDGDFIGYIEKPLITDEMEFYGLLVANLVENNQYRVILSAITWDGLLDFMLLWLPDQRVRLYSTALQDCNSPTCDVNENALDEGEQKFVNSMKIEPIACRRVFYQQLLPNNSLNATQLLDSWRKDFGVTLIHLPWETCIGFSACLNQFSSRIAPHARKLEAPMMGFTSGGVPLIHIPNYST